MYRFIINSFRNLKADLIVQAPARINLINPLDAVEADYWMPAVAIEGKYNPLSVFLYIKERTDKSKIKIYEFLENKLEENNKFSLNLIKAEDLIKDIDKIKEDFTKDLKLIYATLYRISLSNSSFWETIKNNHFEVGILSTIPRQSGLGGSSAIILAFLYGLAKYYNFINKLNGLKEKDIPINKDTLAEICTKVEDKDLKITAGYSDRYVISRGGLSFCSYNGKLYHKKIKHEPLAVYDRIDGIYEINSLPIIICFSGSIHESGNVHKKLRDLYLSNNENLIKNYEKLAQIAWKSRFAIMEKNWERLGQFFKENTKIMNDIMERAGFKYGIGLANNILIDLIQKHPEVYSAKLTGAGGGGSVFALVNPDKLEQIFNYWKKSLEDILYDDQRFKSQFPNYPLEIIDELRNAQFFKIKINKSGVKKI
ncbi:MAG: hypothetical protein ACQERB_11055 [Promethearchaeati archaeon]